MFEKIVIKYSSYLLRYIILYYKKLVGKWLKDVWVCHICMGGLVASIIDTDIPL